MLKLVNYFLLFLVIGFSLFVTVYFFTPDRAHTGADVPIGEGLISRFTKPVEIKESFDRLEKVSTEKIRFPAIISDGGGILYYDQRSGYIHRIDLVTNGFPDIVLQKLRPGLTDVHWSRNTSFIWGKNIDHIVFYNLESGKSSEFNTAVKDFDISPDESHWSYFMTTVNGPGDIFVSGPSFLSPRRLVGVSGANWSIKWVSNNFIALYFQSGNNKSLFVSNIISAGQNLKRIAVDKPTLADLWTPNGKSLVYSLGANGDEILYYLDLEMDTAIQLAAKTPASLCGWSDEHLVICAMYQKITAGKPAPRLVDFYRVKTDGSDPPELIKTHSVIDIVVEKILLSPNRQSIYFENLLDGNFYRLRLN